MKLLQCCYMIRNISGGNNLNGDARLIHTNSELSETKDVNLNACHIKTLESHGLNSISSQTRALRPNTAQYHLIKRLTS